MPAVHSGDTQLAVITSCVRGRDNRIAQDYLSVCVSVHLSAHSTLNRLMHRQEI